MMDILDSYKIQVSFDTVRFVLEQKQNPITEKGKINILKSILFLNSVMQSIDSILTPKTEEKIYHFTPKLRDMIGVGCNKTSVSEDDLDVSKIYFNMIKTQLEKMIDNPQGIYSSPEDTANLKKAISQIMDVYTETPYIVENDFTLSGSIKYGDL
jgi:hypothetical protein